MEQQFLCDLEWKIIKSIVSEAELIGIVTPEFLRMGRREEGDIEKDKQRIKYWHNGGGCLMTELSWTFNGGGSLEINEKLFEEFLEYVRKKELVNQGKTIVFSDKKGERLQKLIAEDKELMYKIEEMNKFIKENKYIKENEKENRNAE